MTYINENFQKDPAQCNNPDSILLYCADKINEMGESETIRIFTRGGFSIQNNTTGILHVYQYEDKL